MEMEKFKLQKRPTVAKREDVPVTTKEDMERFEREAKLYLARQRARRKELQKRMKHFVSREKMSQISKEEIEAGMQRTIDRAKVLTEKMKEESKRHFEDFMKSDSK